MKETHRRGIVLIVAMVAATTTGCRELGTEPEVRVPTSIELAQPALQLASLGERTTIRATVLDQFGQPIPGATVAYTAADPGVVSVATTGEVEARANGETLVQLRVEARGGIPTPSGYRAGVVEATVPVVVRQEVASVRFAGGLGEGGAPLVLWAIGQRRALNVEVRDALDRLVERPVDVQLASQTPQVVEVVAGTQGNEIRAVDDGAGTLRATVEGSAISLGVEVRSGFSFAACVSSSASRLAQRTDAAATGIAGCSSVDMRAIARPR